jgi:hypothetical protein
LANYAIISLHTTRVRRSLMLKNAERQSQLECDLLEKNYEPYAGENVPDDDSGLLEESCFVPDLALEDAKCAGRMILGRMQLFMGWPTVFPVWSGLNP